MAKEETTEEYMAWMMADPKALPVQQGTGLGTLIGTLVGLGVNTFMSER